MLKIMTIIGTRPEIIRLSRIMPRLDEYCDHKIVHTGQNWDPLLNEVFLKTWVFVSRIMSYKLAAHTR